MQKEWATNFAKHLLQANQHLTAFDVDLSNPVEAGAVAEALELLGCKVARDEFKPRLTVVPPAPRGA